MLHTLVNHFSFRRSTATLLIYARVHLVLISHLKVVDLLVTDATLVWQLSGCDSMVIIYLVRLKCPGT